jgi:hypothetical protein
MVALAFLRLENIPWKAPRAPQRQLRILSRVRELFLAHPAAMSDASPFLRGVDHPLVREFPHIVLAAWGPPTWSRHASCDIFLCPGIIIRPRGGMWIVDYRSHVIAGVSLEVARNRLPLAVACDCGYCGVLSLPSAVALEELQRRRGLR